MSQEEAAGYRAATLSPANYALDGGEVDFFGGTLQVEGTPLFVDATGQLWAIAGFGTPPGLSKSISHWRCRVCACCLCQLKSIIITRCGRRSPAALFFAIWRTKLFTNHGENGNYLVIIGFWMNEPERMAHHNERL